MHTGVRLTIVLFVFQVVLRIEPSLWRAPRLGLIWVVELIGIELRITPNTVWAIIIQDLDETLSFLRRTRPFNSSCRRTCVVCPINLVAGDLAFCGAIIRVVWRIHSGAGETHSIFYSSGMTHISAFCDEYTLAHQLSEAFLWWIHSGADEMNSIFPRSIPAFCHEYTLALMRWIQYFLEVHLRFVVNTLWR